MVSKYSLSIVVPVFRGANTIQTLVEHLVQLDIPGGMQIILVVDGSPDNSTEICRKLCASYVTPITVVDLAKNFGEHNAVMAGLGYADGEYVITLDDDLQNPPEEVRKLWQYTQDNDYDVVYAQYRIKMHARWRNLGSRFTNWCMEKTQGKPRGLYLASFRCMARLVVESILSYQGPFPYIDGLVLQTTKNLGSLEVEHLPRPEGSSNYSLLKLFRLFSSMLFNYSVMPLRIGALAGGVLSFLGFVGFFFIVIEALFFSTPPGWATVTSAIFLLTGVQLLVLWLIGEYLGRLYMTVNRKPQFIIRSVFHNDSENSSDNNS